MIRVWNQEEGIVISIADTGVGMSSEHLEALRQACRGRKTSRIGIGLGNITNVSICFIRMQICRSTAGKAGEP